MAAMAAEVMAPVKVVGTAAVETVEGATVEAKEVGMAGVTVGVVMEAAKAARQSVGHNLCSRCQGDIGLAFPSRLELSWDHHLRTSHSSRE